MKLYRYPEYIIVVLCMCVSSIFSVQASADRYYYKHFDIQDGLSQNTVQCILQDSRGFMWFGTKDGLNRYDGADFTTFLYDEAGEFSCGYVQALYEDNDGYIWIATDKGVCVYNPVLETIYRFDTATHSGVTITNITGRIVGDDKNRIWFVVEEQGVFSYNKESNELVQYPVGADILNRSVFTDILFDSHGRIWLSTFGLGLYYSDDEMKTLQPFVDNKGEKVFDGQVINRLCEKYNSLYVASERNGLQEIDLHTKETSVVFAYDYNGTTPIFRDILFVTDSEMWLGSETGIYIYNLKTKEYSHQQHLIYDPYSISDNSVYDLAIDREGGIWIGTYFGGVNYLSKENNYFEKYYQNATQYSLTGQHVREFCQDSYGNIWVGTEDAGLNRFDPVTKRFYHVAESATFKNVHGLCIDGDNLWIGTYSQGVRVLNVKTGMMKSYRHSDGVGLVSDYVFSITRLWNGEIYLGTLSGLQYFDAKTGRFELVERLKDTFIYDIYEDDNGNLWVATYADGVYCRNVKTKKWARYVNNPNEEHSIPSNKVYSIYEDSKHNIWFMTQAGISRYDIHTDSFVSDIHTEDFPQSSVYQMLEDNDGSYWITTNHGLYNIDPSTGKPVKYTTADGLLSNQFNYCSSLKTIDGKLYFGTIDGIVAFKPSDVKADTKLVKPLIVDMWLFNRLVEPGGKESPLIRSISMTDTLELSYNQNSFSFRVVIPGYVAPAKHKIRYKLEGFDKDWVYIDPQYGRIIYSNLNHGDYTLMVAAFNEEEEIVTTLNIIIHPPFYLTPLAYIIYVCLAIAILYYAVRFTTRRQVERNRRQMEEYKREKEREVYDAKFEFFTNVSHEIRTPLSLIKAPLGTLMRTNIVNDKQIKENLDIMNANVDRLLFLVNQLLDFRKVESKKFTIKKENSNISEILNEVYCRFKPTAELNNLKFSIQLPEKDLYADVDHEAFTKIISNLFNNAVKYGKDYINVELTEQAPHFVVVVRNGGEVVSRDMREEIFSAFTRIPGNRNMTGAGIGLPFARSLAQLHDGSLVMGDSETENVFILTIPVGEVVNEPYEKITQVPQVEHILKQYNTNTSVLVVEDNDEMRRFIERQLINNNYRVFGVSNGVEALNLLQEQEVNVIVSDIMMPEMDGLELCRIIKSDISYSHIPVILLTAKSGIQDKIEGLETGADIYIEKPFSNEYLLACISSVVRNRERLREVLGKLPTTIASAEGLSKMDKEFLRKLGEIVQENLQNPDFSMDDIVEMMNMSRSSFYRKIKGIMDVTPNDYIRIQRLKKAAELLSAKKDNVTEICYMVGFNSPSYFAKCFQKYYGVLPKDYAG